MSMATCPSGQGAVCKTVYTGSNPVVASIITNHRRYHSARSVEWALAELKRYAGSQFDPELVAEFVHLVEAGRLPLREGPQAAA
jgi:hypothetical protein